MKIYARHEWGARAPRSSPGTRTVNNEGVVHWSGSKITDGGLAAGLSEPRLPKPKKPGRKWYQLWRDPTSPKAQRRKISRVIRKYNAEMRYWNAKTIGVTGYFDPKLIEQEKRIVRSFQNYHMDGHGWSDIGYHYVIFASGNVYEGRNINSWGAHALNANHTTGFCFVMGPGDTPSQEMLHAFHALRRMHGITRYRGHRQVPGNATWCPGPELERLLKLPVGY